MEKKFSIRAVIIAAAVPTILFGGVAVFNAVKLKDVVAANKSLSQALGNKLDTEEAIEKTHLAVALNNLNLTAYFWHTQKDPGAPHRHKGECDICDRAYYATKLQVKK